MSYEIGRATNGMDGVGQGYDAEAMRIGARILLALYDVRRREWVAMGEMESDDEDVDLAKVARRLAGGALADWDLCWSDRDSDGFKALAEEWDRAVVSSKK